MCNKKEKSKIAFVIDRYRKGGVSVVLEVLLNLLVKENTYDLTLFVRDYDISTMRSIPDGVKCCPWPEFQTLSGAIKSGGLSEAGTLLHNRLVAKLSVLNHGKKTVHKARCRKEFSGEFDCVIAYHMIPNDVAVAALEKIQAKRKILWLHFRKNIAKKEKPTYYKLYAAADAIVCVSEETARLFLKQLPQCASKTMAIHNLYNIPYICNQAQEEPDQMEIKAGPVKIVTAARLAKEKGLDRVPLVVRKLVDAGYDIQWYIVGDGDKREEIQKDIQEKAVTDRVHLLGYCSNPYKYIANCDIYVQSSRMEGFCTSTMEAKILCKPVVTTDVPGMREQFVDGENGLIVESSVDGLYEGIRRLIDSPELRERIVDKLRTEPVPNEAVLKQTMEVIDGTKKEMLE